MPSQPPPPEAPPDDEMHSLPFDAETERKLIGALIYDGETFKRARLKSADLFIQRYRWIWEAAEAIRAADDHIDETSLEEQLRKAGTFEEATALHGLTYLTEPNAWPHVEAYARTIQDRAERRRIIAAANEMARKAFDLNIPLPPGPDQRKTRWSFAELKNGDFPEPDGPVPGLFPNGLTVLGGRPKRGKSWLMLQAACSVALGGRFLERELKCKKVLYYILEDQPRRLKDRLAKLGILACEDITFEQELQPLHLGGLARIEQEITDNEFELIVIDTIRRAMPGKDFNKDGALFDDVLGKLQTLAQRTAVAIVAVLHTRKLGNGFDPDPVDDVLGSTGLTASADCVLALYTEQGKKGAVLKGRGRDLSDIDLALTFDELTCAWQSLGESGEVKVKENEQEILDALAELGKATVGTIAKTINKDFSNTRKYVRTLWVNGKIRKEEIENKTFYFLPGPQAEK